MDENNFENFDGVKNLLYPSDTEDLGNDIICRRASKRHVKVLKEQNINAAKVGFCSSGPSNIENVMSRTLDHYKTMDRMDIEDLSTDEILIYPEKNTHISLNINCDTNSIGKSLEEKNHLQLQFGIEVLGKDNNEWNNNLDYAQSSEDQKSYCSDVEYNMFPTKNNDSRKPDCSKDLYNDEQFFCDTAIEKEARMIHTLLPKLTYTVIRKVLYSNCFALNRIELTLWDLLPYVRPKAQMISKRSISNDACATDHDKSLPQGRDAKIICISSEDSDEEVTSVYDYETVPAMKHKRNIYDGSPNSTPWDNLPNTALNSHYKFNSSSLKCRKMLNTHSSNLPQNLEKNDDNFIFLQPGISKPVQLNFTSRVPMCPKRPIKCNKSILAPSKLARVSAEHDKNRANNTQSSGKYNKILGFAMEKDNSSTASVFMPDAINSARKYSKMQSYNANSLNNYMSYLQDCKNTKQQYLSNDYAQNMKHHEIRGQKFPKKQNLSSTSDCSKDSQCAMESIGTDRIDGNDKVNNRNKAFKKCAFTNIQKEKEPFIQGHGNTNQKNRSQACRGKNSVLLQNVIHSPASTTHLGPKNAGNSGSNTSSNKELSSIASTTTAVIHSNDVAIYDTASTSGNNGAVGYAVSKKEEEEEEVVLLPHMMEFYDEMLDTFKDTNVRHIKKICYVCYHFKDLLVNDGTLHSDIKKLINSLEAEKDICRLDEQYVYLLGVFPDADPSFLRLTAEVLTCNPDLMKMLIQNMMENPVYPTKEQYLAKKKIAEQQKQYTTEFNVRKFVELFPDPFSYFENPARKCNYSETGSEFLNSYFKGFNAEILRYQYSKNNYNLTLTVQAIQKIQGGTRNDGNTPMVLTDNISDLQEFAFIHHKEQIRKYLTEQKARDERAFAALKRRNALLECQCCYEECMPDNCATCDDAHVFCHPCIKSGTETRLSDGNTTVPCFVNCNAEFSLSTLQKVIPPTMFSVLLNKRQEVEVLAAGLEGLVSCPFCHFASIPPPDDKVFVCLNPDCMKESCRLCKKLNHLPDKCVDIRTAKARLFLEEKMTEALVRKCHRCSRPFFKADGCNKITCPCGAIICYICNKSIVGYEHFSSVPGVKTHLCPLWSDENINRNRVVTVAEQTVQQIQVEDPHIMLNAKDLF